MKTLRYSITGQLFPMYLILKTAELSSSAWYDKRPRVKSDDKRKRGPKTLLSDNDILNEIN